MEHEKWSDASLRVSGQTLEPDEISRLLDLRPTRTHRRGELRGLRGESAKHVWNRSLWLLQSPLSKDRDLAEHLKWLLDSLEPRLSVFKEVAGKYDVELFCGFSSESGQGGFTLDANTIQRIANLGVPLTLDLYPPQSEETRE